MPNDVTFPALSLLQNGESYYAMLKGLNEKTAGDILHLCYTKYALIKLATVLNGNIV